MWSAGRDRVVTRGRGLCLPSVLLPPSAPTSYHKKVTSVAKEQRGIRGFSFRESASPEAQFPGTPLLGSSVNTGNLPTTCVDYATKYALKTLLTADGLLARIVAVVLLFLLFT